MTIIPKNYAKTDALTLLVSRDGYCKFDAHDPGSHTVCANITQVTLPSSSTPPFLPGTLCTI